MTALYADYDAWKTGVGDWLDTDDTTKLATYIALAELDLHKRLRIREMVETATATVDSDFQITLPTDFIKAKRIKISGKYETLKPENWDYVETLDTTGTPKYFAIQGTQLKIGPGGNGETIELSYYAKPTPLGDANDSNVYTDYAAEALLYGSIIQGLKFLIEDERLVSWQQMYLDAVAQLNDAAREGEYGDAPLTRRPAAQRDRRQKRNTTTTA